MLHPRVLGSALALIVLLGNSTFALGQDADAAIVNTLSLPESELPVRQMKTWRKPRKVVVLIDSAARLNWFREAVADSDVELFGAHNPAEFLSLIQGADAVEGICNADIVAADPQLRWIQTQGAGVEACVAIPRIANGEIIVTNMQRVDAANVAEHTFALVLALSRQLPALAGMQNKKLWGANLPRDMLDLEGSTLLIVGLGGNGTAIAERAHAFGMHVIATRAGGVPASAFVDHIGAPEELSSLITQADIVVNATPLTPATTGLFNAAMFGKMKRSALFINVGRGASVVTGDLASALNAGQIAGAGLDVVDPEPLPSDSALWEASNLIITPHVADHSPRRMQRFWAVMRENLRRYVHGDRLLSVVDAKRGY